MGFFDVSLDTANQFYAWGWRASVAGALLTTFGVGFLFWGTRVRDHDFEESIAKLHDRAASSEERTEELRNGNLTLQGNLDRERAARLKIEEQLKPRAISDAQEAVILSILRQTPKGVVHVIASFFDGTDAKPYAARIKAILEKAGFEVTEPEGELKQVVGWDRAGAWMMLLNVEKSPPHAFGIQKAFMTGGHFFEGQPNPKVEEGAVVIAVGSHP